MRSWIFRHRYRLRAIYGPRPVPASATAVRERTPPDRWAGLAPGECARRGDTYVLRPMRRPAA